MLSKTIISEELDFLPNGRIYYHKKLATFGPKVKMFINQKTRIDESEVRQWTILESWNNNE